MISLALAFFTSLIIAAVFIPFIISYSRKKKIYDIPGRRRVHKKITPSLGGTAIFCGSTIASILWIDESKRPESFLILSILIIPFVIGLLDDLMHLKPSVKLLAQALTATLVFFFLNVRLQSLYGLLDMQFPLGVSFLLTVFVIILITNSFNLIDGIDGLAGTVAFVVILFYGIWFYLTANLTYSLICFCFLGGILAFLISNWEPSKIFMGDTGSLIIGTLLSILSVQFINDNHRLPDGTFGKLQASVGTAICVLIIPLADTLRVIIIRLRKGLSVFTPDKRHVHHALIRLGLSHSNSVLILLAVNLVFIALALALNDSNDVVLLLTAAVLAVTLTTTLDRFLYRQASR
jgi:UDP-GlcNAc:undecaprenyl-phosphate/decaprenyl-phosphate GlcNAc-1-phosphate transferase